MKIKGVILAMAILMISGKGFSQKKDPILIKQKIDQLLSSKVAEELAGGGMSFLPGQVTFDDKRQAQMNIIYSGFDPIGNEYPRQAWIKPYYSDTIINEVVMHVGSCKTYKPVFEPVVYETNSKNQTIKATKALYFRSGDGYNREFYNLEYDEKGRVVHAIANTTVAKGKSVSNVTDLFSYKMAEGWAVWSEDNSELTITGNGYASKTKEKDPDRKTSTTKSKYFFAEGQLVGIQYFDEQGDVRQEDRLLLNSDSLVKKSVTTSKARSETSYHIGKGGLIKYSETLEMGSDGTINSRTATKIEYENEEEASLNICSAKSKYLTQVYDGTGVLVREKTNTHVRMKNEDGTWGEWKTLTY